MVTSTAGIVLLACLVGLGRASGRLPTSLDGVIFLQHDLSRAEKANATRHTTPPEEPSADTAAPTYVVGESAEVKGGGAQVGKWFPCSIKSLGPRPHEYTITLATVGDMTAHARVLRKARPEALNWVPGFRAGEHVEVFATTPPFTGQWIQARILGQGTVANAYYIQVPVIEADAIPDVPLASLRKLREPVASGCSTEDRMQALHTFFTKGNMVFGGWATKCENFMPADGVDYERLNKCVQEVLPVSPMCSLCGVDFMKEAMGPRCSSKCTPMASSCTSLISPSDRCMDDTVKCMDCTMPALHSLFECVGINDPSLSGKLSQLRNAAANHLQAMPGANDGTFAVIIDMLGRSVAAGR
mmetsp:Transcript_59494/g.159362  ORF Transcript_59494/g.159362 Transcript_59494/m.159362 type:complete len:357 (-) Transcript_59494:58-1128(-)|eukprot:CAMPEP_0171181608 /NCGR_PEP_ID=MMETSP0790-20130122/14344_1 /TAXON_ID=2925 /ORGANISM="Alexandrium catenella, Strain OF101" /LENGTH=356 /DNA_ID=CAMNT_0011646545 /DNA_START=63 /DNA_END=1133 /DNA_ORIENTATION=+